jgi:SAM-dependent methyltransferase
LMQFIEVPTLVYQIGFMLTLVLYWSVHNTRVPFYPSFPATWRAMLHVCDHHAEVQTLRVLDIGSGLGDVAMYLARHRLQDHVSGIEIAPLPWLISWLRAKLGGSAASFQLGDYRKLDFSQLDVVFAYLSPAVMMDVWLKVEQEMLPGSLFVSSEFAVPGITPTHTVFPSQHSPVLYVYVL